MTFLVIGHRGASAIAPENTLKAFQEAIGLKADYIEFDLLKTKDGELVICHDHDLKRITGKEGLIANMTLKELRRLDFGEGEKIPTLRELLELTKNRIGLNCEILVKGITQPTIEIFREYEILSTTIISSFIHEELIEIQKLEPEIKLASLEPTVENRNKVIDWDIKKKMIQFCMVNNFYAINPIAMMVDQQFVEYAHHHNIKVFPWTVDSKIMIKKLIRFGVDGIVSDDISNTQKIIAQYS